VVAIYVEIIITIKGIGHSTATPQLSKVRLYICAALTGVANDLRPPKPTPVSSYSGSGKGNWSRCLPPATLLSPWAIPVCNHHYRPVLERRRPTKRASNSDGHEVLAHYVRYLHVSLLVLAPSRIHIIPRIAAGSSSPPLTLSGTSSDDINVIDGRYGYVPIGL
jgi:hypothetical protein